MALILDVWRWLQKLFAVLRGMTSRSGSKKGGRRPAVAKLDVAKQPTAASETQSMGTSMTTFPSLTKQNWPSEQAAGALDNFYGNPRGSGGRADQAWMQQNLTTIVPPWAMTIEGGPVSQITIHKNCKDSLARILNAIWDFSGHDLTKIKAAHLDQFDGTYNFRPNVNSPSKLSLHAYGAAIDLAAAENPNGVTWKDDGAMLPRWAIDAFLAEGWCWGGDFSGTPDAMHFQATLNRHTDAPPGQPQQPQQQPTSISSASAQLTADKKFTVTATVFGGAKDRNTSCYDGHLINDQELGVALPFHFSGPRPKVTVSANGKVVTCPIIDVGPWNTRDPYWMTSGHPQAASGKDMTGRTTNGAGIDLTPAAAAAIGLNGKGQVVWFFDPIGVTPMPNGTTSVTPILVQIKQQIDTLLKQGGAAPTLPLPGLPLLPPLNPADVQNINKALEAFVATATTILPILSAFVPQLKLLIPVLPMLQGLLQMGDDIAKAGNDPTQIANALAANLTKVAQQVQALKLPGQS